MDERDYADMQIKAMKEDFDPSKLTPYKLKLWKKKQQEFLEWVKGTNG